MADIVNPKIWDKSSSFQREYAQARPFPHFVVENFLDEKFGQKIYEEFPAFDTKKARNESGEIGGKAVREDMPRISAAYADLDRLFASRKFLDWMSYSTEIPDLIYDPTYFGGGTHENMPGQDLSLHVDFNYHQTKGWHRRINALLYLNPEWEESWGGALELWKNPWDKPAKNEIRKILPVWNRLVVFGTTEESWHGFEKVMIPEKKQSQFPSRKSIAIYLYSKDRPKHEIRKLHGTIYYERPMPESIKADEKISESDWLEVNRLTIRRDELLKFLYERESQFAETVEELNKNIQQREYQLRETSEELAITLQRLDQFTRTHLIWQESLLDPGKLQLTISGASEFTVRKGITLTPMLGPNYRIEIGQLSEARAGDWLLTQRENGTHHELVRMVEKIPAIGFVCWEPGTNIALLVPHGAVCGRVSKILNEHNLPVNLDLPLPQISRHATWLARAFPALHYGKNFFLGQFKSPLLWRISQVYRNALRRLGLEVPVILPPDTRSSREP